MRLRKHPGFSYYRLKGGRFKCTWLENGVRHWLTVYSMTEVMSLALRLKAKLSAKELEQSEIVPVLIGLEEAIEGYPTLMIRGEVQAKAKTKALTVWCLRRMFRICGWSTFEDITEKSFAVYEAMRRHQKSTLATEISRLKTFIRRHANIGVVMPAWLEAFHVTVPPARHIHSAWDDATYFKWWRYLTEGMEQLAQIGPEYSWHERIIRCCHDSAFAQRMRLIPIELLQARGLYRPSESRRVQAQDWNGERKFLKLSPFAMKVRIKAALTDDESAWMYDACTIGAFAERPIAQSSTGLVWTDRYLSAVMREHLNVAGLNDKFPYDIKYTIATFIFNNPELFEDQDFAKRIDRVRKVLGHGKESKMTERYIESMWGSEYAKPVQSFFNTQKLFPFDVAKYPLPKFKCP